MPGLGKGLGSRRPDGQSRRGPGGWEHRNHAALFAAVTRLAAETGDEDIRRLFAVANSPHVNFCENWDTPQNVAGNLNDVEQFLAKVEPLLGG